MKTILIIVLVLLIISLIACVYIFVGLVYLGQGKEYDPLKKVKAWFKRVRYSLKEGNDGSAS